MGFSETLNTMVSEGGEWRAAVDDAWLQGRSVFGGMQAAVALRAMKALVPPELPLRVLQMTFVAPVAAGTVRVRPRVLRTGKSATHVEARLGSGDDTSALVIGIFGRGRASRVRVVPARPALPAPSPLDLTYVEGVSPRFTRNFEIRWLEGALPFTGSTSTRAAVQVAMLDGGPATAEHVVAVADVPPPIALSFLDSPAPGSSMTWTLEMLTDDVSKLPLRGFRLDVELVAGKDGYTSQSVMMWGPEGEPVALSRQSMVVFG